MAEVNTSAQSSSSATLAQLLQQMLDNGASAQELIDTAKLAGATLDPVLTQQMVDYGKGAQFLPGIGGEVTPATPAAPETQPTATRAAANVLEDYYRNEAPGLDPETLRMFGAMPGEFSGPGGLLGAINYAVLAPANLIRGGILEPLEAGTEAVVTGAGQALANIPTGGNKTALDRLGDIFNPGVVATPQNLARDVLDFGNIASLYAGATPMPAPRVPAPGQVSAAPRIAEVAAEVTPPRIPTPKAVKAATTAEPTGAAALKQEGPASLAQMAEAGQTEDILKLPAHKRVTNFQADVGTELDALGITRATERGGKPYPFQDFIADHLNAGTLPNETVSALIQKHGLLDEKDLRTALGASMDSATKAARILNLNSQASRTVLRLVEQNPGLGISLANANTAANSLNAIGSFIRYVGRTRAGLLTGTIGTAARNAWAGSPIMPTYSMLTEVADAAIRQTRNLKRANAGQELLPGPTVTDALYSYMDELSRSIQLAGRGLTGGRLGVTSAQKRSDNLLTAMRDAFPKQNNDLFATYASDLPRQYRDPNTVTGKLAKGVDRFIEFANVGNQLVARWTKNAQFPAILRMEAKRNGVDLDALYDAGQISSLDPKIVEDAVRLMQKRLFDERPQGKLGKSFVNVMEYTTQPLGVTPFPNFAVSYFKYVAEQNPAAVVRFASKAEREKIARGDHRAVGKIMAGLATTLAFLATGDDEGEWYEIKDPVSGKQIDARATLSPYVPNMFAAHVIRKALAGDLASVRTDDALKVIGASNLRAGAGAYAVDNLVADITGAGGSENGVRKAIDNWAKEYVPGFFRFFSQFKDASGQFVEQDRLRRMPETTGQAVMSQLPGGNALYEAVSGQSIPESQSITREATPATVNPLLRTLVGVTVPEDQNFLEKTIVRSGLRPSDLYRNTGVGDFDKLMREKLGEAADKYIIPSMERNRDKVESLSGPELRLKLRDVYERNRAAVRKEIYTEDPRLKLMLKFDALSEDERKLENQKALRKKGKTVVDMFRESEGKPLVWTDEDVARLPAGTQYMDTRDYILKVKK